jgi:hypothetical protein
MKFKKYLNDLSEETTSADIATVDTKLDMVKRHEKHAHKGKKCKIHKKYDCEICEDLAESKFH